LNEPFYLSPTDNLDRDILPEIAFLHSLGRQVTFDLLALTLLNAINWNIYARALTGVRWSRFVFIQSASLNHRGVRAI
jgi:hypothetical protein